MANTTTSITPSLNPHQSPGSIQTKKMFYYYQHHLTSIVNLTSDRGVNPFRSILPLTVHSEPLQYAIVLLAVTHRQYAPIERMSIRSKALQSFAVALPSLDDLTKMAIIFILLYTDSVESGFGFWRTHLNAVRIILSNMFRNGDSHTFLQSDIHKALILQFYWWDTIGALLSVQEPILPPFLLETVLHFGKTKEQSDFDSVTIGYFGCTEKMFLQLNRMAWGLERSVKAIENVPVTDPTLLERLASSPEQAAERTHVEEIWKNAAITYLLTSVAPYVAPRHVFEVYATRVFEHAACLPVTSRLRRGILYPLIIAGSCTQYDARREFVRRYCIHYYEETKFGIFQRGLKISWEVGMLRAKEQAEMRAGAGAAYSCWRNVTATESAEHAMLG